MRRRTFITRAAMGMTAFASGVLPALGAESPVISKTGSAATSPVADAIPSVGRPVRIVSIGFLGTGMPLERIAKHVDAEGARGADVIVLPELSRGQDGSSEEPLNGPTVTAMAALAAKHRTYIAVPIDRLAQQKRLNTVVLLDRAGHVACHYDKVFPYWSEYSVTPPVSPGDSAEVFHADFGRIGIATCFDVNFPEVWKRLSEQKAEVVLWPSAYSAGISLQAHAINYHYYIVSSTATPDCIVYDITGERILYESAKDMNVSRVTLDLDRGIYHQNFNLDKLDKLLKEHAQDVAQEKWMGLEQWFVLKAKRPDVSARALAQQYGLEELPHYLDRSRVAIDQRRGWEFSAMTDFPGKTVSELQTFASKKGA
jgi:predicted amidohydrolase